MVAKCCRVDQTNFVDPFGVLFNLVAYSELVKILKVVELLREDVMPALSHVEC